MHVSRVLQQIRQDKRLEYTADFVKSFSPEEDEIAYTQASSKYCHLLYLELLPGYLHQGYASHSHLISLWLGRLWSWAPTSPPQHEQSTSSKPVIKCSPKYLCLGIFPILFWWLWNIPLGTSAGLYGAVSSSDLALLANSLSTVPFFFPPVSSLLTWLFTFWSFLARCRPICIERSEFPLILRAEYTMSKNDGL